MDNTGYTEKSGVVGFYALTQWMNANYFGIHFFRSVLSVYSVVNSRF